MPPNYEPTALSGSFLVTVQSIYSLVIKRLSLATVRCDFGGTMMLTDNPHAIIICFETENLSEIIPPGTISLRSSVRFWIFINRFSFSVVLDQQTRRARRIERCCTFYLAHLP